MAARPPAHGRRHFNQPRPPSGGGLQVTFDHSPSGNQKFQNIPAPTGAPPFHLSLKDVAPDAVDKINKAKLMVFQTVGDTGGVKDPKPQIIVADKMEQDFTRSDGAAPPSFFYHLGDVVYYYGASGEYFNQFYDPYVHYPAPVFAITGNHDMDVDPTNPAPPLEAFMRNFCAPKPQITPDAGEVTRDAMTQPNAYWTLDTPYATIVGLCTNVPEGGVVQNDQATWFQKELQDAPADKALIVALHHPTYSADAHHGGSLAMVQLLDNSMKVAKRIPDAVLMGHVHNYQRFTRQLDKRDIPYIVAGAGGYWHLHSMSPLLKGIQRPVQIPGQPLTLESWAADHHGFLRIEVNDQTLKGEYYEAPRPQDSWSAQPLLWDSFTLDLKQHTLVRDPSVKLG